MNSPLQHSPEQIVLDYLSEDEYWLWEIKGFVDHEPGCGGSSKEEILSNLVKAKLVYIGKRKPLESDGRALTEKDALQILQLSDSWVAVESDETELYFADLCRRRLALSGRSEVGCG